MEISNVLLLRKRVLRNIGIGPISGGLWNRSIYIPEHKHLLLSSKESFCGGGTSFYSENNGIFSGPKWFNIPITSEKSSPYIPTGAMAWWPEKGLIGFDQNWGTGFLYAMDENGFPKSPKIDEEEDIVPDAYPIFSKFDIKEHSDRDITSISVGDVTGNGYNDVLLSVVNWRTDGYHPGGLSWGNHGYKPYEQRTDENPGKALKRDEKNPFWGSNTLNDYLGEYSIDSEGCARKSSKTLWGGDAGNDILCSNLPLKGSMDFSLERTYRGNPTYSRFLLLEGNGTLNNIEEDDCSFEYIGCIKDENNEEIKTYAHSDVAILNNGDFVTIDFLGQIQYFRKINNITFKEMPVFMENNYISAIHGCIGTITPVRYKDINNKDETYLVVSGEFGIISKVKAKIIPEGISIQSPDMNILKSENDFFKEDILVVPSFYDSQQLILGSGAGRYSMVEFCKNNMILRKEPFTNLRIQAGPVGSVQGTTEEKWGYTCPTVYDWYGNGEKIIVSGDISEYIWLIDEKGNRNVLRDNDSNPVRFAWRVRPAVFELNNEIYLISIDQQDNLVIYRKNGENIELHGNILNDKDNPYCFGRYGGSKGRLKFEAIQGKNENGLPDLLIGTCSKVDFNGFIAKKASVLRISSIGDIDKWKLGVIEQLSDRENDSKDYELIIFGGHSCAPATIPDDWDGREAKKGNSLIVGAEDGRLYYFKNPKFLEINKRKN